MFMFRYYTVRGINKKFDNYEDALQVAENYFGELYKKFVEEKFGVTNNKKLAEKYIIISEV